MHRSQIKLIVFLLSAIVSLTNCNKGRDAGTNSAANRSAQIRTSIKFDDGAQSTGIDFLHVPTRTSERLMPEIMGSGIAIVDVNRDGAPDVVLVNSGAVRESSRPQNAPNRLYINDGRGHFSDKTTEWKIPSSGYGMGVAAGDFDNDGWVDLFLTTYRGDDVLLRNTGNSFEDVTQKAGIKSDGGWSTGAGFLIWTMTAIWICGKFAMSITRPRIP